LAKLDAKAEWCILPDMVYRLYCNTVVLNAIEI